MKFINIGFLRVSNRYCNISYLQILASILTD